MLKWWIYPLLVRPCWTGTRKIWIHTMRSVDSLLSLFKSSYRSERIDSVCRLLAEKENLLNKIMLVLNEQEEIKDKIARRVPVIARKSSQEEPPKRKRTGFLGFLRTVRKKGRSETDCYDFHAQYAEQ